MDILKIFKIEDEEFYINIIGTAEQPLFQATQIGQLLGLLNIKNIIRLYEEKYKVKKEIQTNKGKQRANFLTSQGLYRVINRSNKPIARAFQEWVCKVIDEIRLTGKYELNNEDEYDKRMLERKCELERHKVLIETLRCKRVVYICVLDKYRNINNTEKNLYKIGYTGNIVKRISSLESAYECTITLLNAFECNNNQDFESFLFKNPFISSHKFTEKLFKQDTREIFLLSLDDLEEVRKIINRNIGNFATYNSEHIIELKRLEADIQQSKLEIVKTLQINKNSTDTPIQNDIVQNIYNEIQEEYEDCDEEYEEFLPQQKTIFEWKEGMPLYLDNKQRVNTKSPWVQKYDPNTLQLIESSDSISDYIRQNPELSYTGLKTAYKENTIYKGFRWLFVDKRKENIQYTLEPTKHIISRNIPNELIAMLDIDKTKIVEIYPSQKHAAESRHFSSIASISLALKKGTLSAGHYWKRYDDCSDELKATYTKPLPEKIRKANGAKKVQIINPLTNEPVRIFETVTDVMKEFQMSRTKLNQVCSNKEIYKNWIFQFVA